MDRFAKFIRRLDSMVELDGTSVLHNSMIVYGCAIGDATATTTTNSPLFSPVRVAAVCNPAVTGNSINPLR
jgi:hypothetical protein